MRLDPAGPADGTTTALLGVPTGVFPYLGASTPDDQVSQVLRDLGIAVITGKTGAERAQEVPGCLLLDPGQYWPESDENEPRLFKYQDWLERQRAARVPVVLTDTPRVPNGDGTALRSALERWASLPEQTLVVLPIEAWWLTKGLVQLVAAVQNAERPVGLVLLNHYNCLDTAGAVAGLVSFVNAVAPLSVVLLRFDISAIGAVAHGAHAGFVGGLSTVRHGPLPMRSSPNGDSSPDKSPSVYVPALHVYLKASRLPALAGIEGTDLLTCTDGECQGASLLKIARLVEVDLDRARQAASRHNVASCEHVARWVLGSEDPRGRWWELCRLGAERAHGLNRHGINLVDSPWLNQWIELGSPSHGPVRIG